MRRKSGFTLIELLLAMGVLTLILSISAGVLLSVIRTAERRSALSQVERAGDFLMRVIEEDLRVAYSVDCVNSSGSTGSCGSTYNILRINDGETYQYIGRKIKNDVTCEDGSTVSNGYIYKTSNVSHLASGHSVDVSEKLTDDTQSGTNIQILSLSIVGGRPSGVTVGTTIVPSSCQSWNIQRSYSTFVTLRGTYQ